MTKQTGLGDNLYIGGYNISGDVGVVDNVSGPHATLTMTGVDKFAIEREYSDSDGLIEYTSFFNDASNASHVAHSPLPRTSTVVTYARGTTLGAPSACLMAKQVNYDMSRGDDASLTFKIQAVGSDGYPLEWGRLLTAGVRTDAAATNGASIDDTTPTALGLQAYLHVMAMTGAGTDLTLAIEESTDDASWSPVTGGAFATILGTGFAPYSERIATADDLAVERYLRLVSTTSGGVTSCSFAITVIRNLG